MPYNLTTMQFIYHGQDEIVEITYNGSPVYQKGGPTPPLFDLTEHFYIENDTNSTQTITFNRHGSYTPNNFDLYYSLDKTTWSVCGNTSATFTYNIPANTKVYFRSEIDTWDGISILGCTKTGGNIMSLLYGSSFNGTQRTFPQSSWNYVFSELFKNNTTITTGPILSATTLSAGCYSSMFEGCTSINTVICLATNNTGIPWTGNWLLNVPATGTFYKAAGVTWPTGTSGIPSGWTVIEV